MRCDTGNLTLPRCGIHPCGARGLRSECHAHPGRSLRASACAAGKLVDRFAFSRACASIGGGVCGYRRRSGFLPYDHVLFGEDQEQEE